MLIVQKYGGTSVQDTARIYAAARRAAQLAAQGHRVVVVVSAQGHTTDSLIATARSIATNSSPRELDAYICVGEQLSAGLFTMALGQLGCKAISLTGWQAGLFTDGNHGDARILGLRGDRIRRELDQGNTVVVAGFQGLGPGEDITTLGRGGSDTTAVALAVYLQADLCQIYTDVDGVYDRDPRKDPGAIRFDRIGYDPMLRLIRHGAQVLHQPCVELAKKYALPIEVRSAFTDEPGTIVGP